MPPDVDTKQVGEEYLRIMKEYNLKELAIESDCYSDTKYSDTEAYRKLRDSEGTPEYQKVMSYYVVTPPTIEEIIANDGLLPFEKLHIALLVAMLPA